MLNRSRSVRAGAETGARITWWHTEAIERVIWSEMELKPNCTAQRIWTWSSAGAETARHAGATELDAGAGAKALKLKMKLKLELNLKQARTACGIDRITGAGLWVRARARCAHHTGGREYLINTSSTKSSCVFTILSLSVCFSDSICYFYFIFCLFIVFFNILSFLSTLIVCFCSS